MVFHGLLRPISVMESSLCWVVGWNVNISPLWLVAASPAGNRTHAHNRVPEQRGDTARSGVTIACLLKGLRLRSHWTQVSTDVFLRDLKQDCAPEISQTWMRAVHKNTHYYTDGHQNVCHAWKSSFRWLTAVLFCAVLSMNAFCQNNENKARFVAIDCFLGTEWKRWWTSVFSMNDALGWTVTVSNQ